MTEAQLTAEQVAAFFIETANAEDSQDGEGISNMKLNKLLYFAQAASLQKTGQPLFSERIYAWQHGPVINNIYHSYKEYGKTPIIRPKEPLRIEELSAEQIDILSEVYIQFAEQYTAIGLRNRTHRPGTPWSQSYVQDGYNQVIPVDLIKTYVESHPVLEPREDSQEVSDEAIDVLPVGSPIPDDWDD